VLNTIRHVKGNDLETSFSFFVNVINTNWMRNFNIDFILDFLIFISFVWICNRVILIILYNFKLQ
jgi:hypothetical protein